MLNTLKQIKDVCTTPHDMVLLNDLGNEAVDDLCITLAVIKRAHFLMPCDIFECDVKYNSAG